MADCIFCGIVEGSVPSDKVYEDDSVLAFRDINPAAPVHVLIIPKKHVPSLLDAEEEPELMGKVIAAASKVAKELGLAENGFRLVNNCGKHGLQTVYHIHFHLIGGRQLSWPPG
ncbi:histidine triad (HIT) family protein [Planifilum fimeticola]|uniref:Histidine triad (HIT) family protein n=1 Tax=Planifilum fimeticola TaxID=201975 RepID=A0A2T0LG76_9BACL|nr:histidine triad nucleotide-binding protein [Planifilum fimeticola]PRX41131.1 histidine triad (HIT) family protein [Planifilum fimeticola]